MDFTAFWRHISRNIILTILWVLGNTVTTTYSEGCNKLTISKTMWQGNREGTYKLVSAPPSCSTNAPVYHQDNGGNYLYYIEVTGGWKGWMVGTSPCVNSGGIAVQDSASYPEEVTGNWEEVYAGNWYYSYHMHVECYRLSGAAIAGIVVACVIVLVVVIIIIVCCCCNNQKNTNTVQTNRSNTTGSIFATTTSNSVRYNGQQASVQHQNPGYFNGPPAYGAPMVHGYGPPPVYSTAASSDQQAYPPTQGTPGAIAPRSESVPPSYAAQAPNGHADPFAYPTKVDE